MVHMSANKSLVRFTLGLVLCAYIHVSVASDWCADTSTECANVGEWKVALGFGYGQRSNPVADNDDIPLIVLPSVSYYGKRFYIENLNLGYQLISRKRFDFNLVISPGRDHTYFNRWSVGNFSVDGSEVSSVDALAEFAPAEAVGDGSGVLNPSAENEVFAYEASLNKRKISVLAGVDLHAYFGAYSFAVQALNDVRGVHDGAELRAAISRDFESGRLRLRPAAGLIWQDDKTIDYYYGVDDDEVLYSSLAYHAGSGLSPFVRLDLNYTLSKRWSLKALLYQRQLASSIKDSPIVNASTATTIFFGGVYHF